LNGSGRWLIFLLVLFGLGAAIYWEPLYALTVSILKRRASSHGLFVPFIAGYFIWLKLDKIREVKHQIALLPGAAMVMAGFALYYLNQGGPGFTLPVLSFLLVTGKARGRILNIKFWSLADDRCCKWLGLIINSSFTLPINRFPVNISKNSDIISHDFRNDAVTLFYFTAFLVCRETIIENRISGSIPFIFRICNSS